MFSRPIFIGLLCCLISLRPVQAQESSPAPVTSTKIEAAMPFDPVEATKAWLNTVPPDNGANFDPYFEVGYWLIHRQFHCANLRRTTLQHLQAADGHENPRLDSDHGAGQSNSSDAGLRSRRLPSNNARQCERSRHARHHPDRLER